MAVTMRTSGPLFEGKADGVLADFLDACEQEVAQAGVGIVRSELRAVLRHPTGYYSGHIATAHDSAGWQVTDSGVIYGPWLAGTGSRNRTTRFKGYAHWRRSLQRLDKLAGQVAERILPDFLRRLS